MPITSEAQRIYNLTQHDSASRKLYNCSDNVLWVPDLPKNVSVNMKHGSVNRVGNNFKIYPRAYWQTGPDTMVVTNAEGEVLLRSFWTYVDCKPDNLPPAYSERSVLRLGKADLKKEHTVLTNEHVTFHLTTEELYQFPRLYLIDTSIKIVQYSLSYHRKGTHELEGPISFGYTVDSPINFDEETRKISALLLTMKSGDWLFFDDIYFINPVPPYRRQALGSISFKID